MMTDDAPARVLLIAGSGRSGSTMLANLLGSLPGVFSGGEIRYRVGVPRGSARALRPSETNFLGQVCAWLVPGDPSCGDPLLADRELDARCSAGLARPYRR